MTRKDWEKIERVLKDVKRTVDQTHASIPDYPSAEWMRRRIAIQLADEFGITDEEQRNKFLKQAGVIYP